MIGSIGPDVHAERGVVGCWLHGCIDDDLDVRWITDDGRRALLLAVDAMRGEGMICVPYDDHPARVMGAALSNAEMAAHLVVATGIWWYDADPRVELRRCLDGATLHILDYYVRRVRAAYERRIEIGAVERRLHQLVSEVA